MKYTQLSTGEKQLLIYHHQRPPSGDVRIVGIIVGLTVLGNSDSASDRALPLLGPGRNLILGKTKQSKGVADAFFGFGLHRQCPIEGKIEDAKGFLLEDWC